MPGIVATISAASHAEQEQTLERMIKPLMRGAQLTAERQADESCGLGVVSLKRQTPTLAHDDGIWLAFTGWVTEDSLLPGVPGQSIAQRLLDAYCRAGTKALCDLNGTYLVAVWEESSRRLTVVNDRLGYYAAFYWQASDRLMLASEYKSISWHPNFNKAIDTAAVADLFLYEFANAGRSLFRDIRMLPPASILTYEQGRLRIESYWTPDIAQASTPPKASSAKDWDRLDIEYADRLAFYMRRSVERRIHPDTAMLITGGLDSRVVAGLYREIDPTMPLMSTTMGVPYGKDLAIGRELARVLGLPHKHVPLGTDYLALAAPLVIWRGEGQLGAYASWIVLLSPFLGSHNLQYALTGLFGNFISGRHYPPGLVNAASLAEGFQSAELFIKPYIPGLTEIMRPEVLREALPASASFVKDTFYELPKGTSISQRFDRVVMLSRIAYGGKTQTPLGDVSLPFEPFLDKDVIDFALEGMPDAVRTRALFYHHMIVRHLPKAAAVRYGRTGFPLPLDLAISRRPWLSTVDDLRRRALKRIFPNRYSNAATSCVPHAAALREGSRAYVEAVFSRADLIDDLFDMRAVRAMLDEHIAGKRNAFMTLDALLTFAIWREQFCQNDGPGESDAAFQALATSSA